MRSLRYGIIFIYLSKYNIQFIHLKPKQIKRNIHFYFQVEVVQNSTEVVEEVAKEAKEEENGDLLDEVDGNEKNENDGDLGRRRRGRVSQVPVTLQENQRENESIDSLVTLNDELESEKKVRQRQSKANRRERQDYSTRTSKGNVRLSSKRVKRRDEYYERRHHRLILYQEICV